MARPFDLHGRSVLPCTFTAPYVACKAGSFFGDAEQRRSSQPEQDHPSLMKPRFSEISLGVGGHHAQQHDGGQTLRRLFFGSLAPSRSKQILTASRNSTATIASPPSGGPRIPVWKYGSPEKRGKSFSKSRSSASLAKISHLIDPLASRNSKGRPAYTYDCEQRLEDIENSLRRIENKLNQDVETILNVLQDRKDLITLSQRSDADHNKGPKTLINIAASTDDNNRPSAATRTLRHQPFSIPCTSRPPLPPPFTDQNHLSSGAGGGWSANACRLPRFPRSYTDVLPPPAPHQTSLDFNYLGDNSVYGTSSFERRHTELSHLLLHGFGFGFGKNDGFHGFGFDQSKHAYRPRETATSRSTSSDSRCRLKSVKLKQMSLPEYESTMAADAAIELGGGDEDCTSNVPSTTEAERQRRQQVPDGNVRLTDSLSVSSRRFPSLPPPGSLDSPRDGADSSLE
uniref:Uncharacterized protein n=1 Tax=Romanomermis culicivorax TaxID=13658 RepID=A0A915II47_ROMCU